MNQYKVDLDLLKILAMTEKTQEDIERIMSLTQGLPFVINYNNPDIHKLICQNMKLKDYSPEQTIYDSSKQTNIDFLIYSGGVNLYTCEVRNEKESLNLIREMGIGDCFGSFEFSILEKNLTIVGKLLAMANAKTKIIIFENKKIDNNIPKTKRDIINTQRENMKSQFEPDIFLFDNPQKINEIIDSVKNKVNEEFSNFNRYESVIYKLKAEKEFEEIIDEFPEKKEFKEIFNWIDNKYGKDYTDDAILDLKLGILSMKCIDTIPKINDDINKSLDELKNKFYDKNNAKNKNLIQLNIDKELESDDFHDYIYDQINSQKKLDDLMDLKKKNETKIEQNKKLIKKEENLLLNTYYCIYCHTRPRDAISTNCHHLVICEECMKKTKICPRCGVNIDNYHKIYRS